MPKRIPNRKDLDAIQQPLDKDGFSNPWFDEVYGKGKNPHTGTERDRTLRKKFTTIGRPAAWLIEREKKKLKTLKKGSKEYKKIKKWLKDWAEE